VAVRPRKALGRLMVERAYEHEARLRFRHVTAFGRGLTVLTRASSGLKALRQPPSASVSLIVNIRGTQNVALTVLHAISAFGMLTKARRELA
jgi:hypothetical protein